MRCYANLYSQARVDALDALHTLPQLREATELKSKILFSVVVVRLTHQNFFLCFHHYLDSISFIIQTVSITRADGDSEELTIVILRV